MVGVVVGGGTEMGRVSELRAIAPMDRWTTQPTPPNTHTVGELEPANRGPRGRAPARRLHRPLGAVLP